MERLARSVLGLLPQAVVVALVCLVAARRALTDRRRLRFFLAGAVLLMLAGAGVAASDDWNDELWNPVMWGSPFIAAMPLATLVLFWRRRAVWSRVAVGVMVLPVLTLALWLAGDEWLTWALDRGWPVAW